MQSKCIIQNTRFFKEVLKNSINKFFRDNVPAYKIWHDIEMNAILPDINKHLTIILIYGSLRFHKL